ncbi:MAG: hypothetical protein R3C10_00775 [Pirellulales bacterium]
MPADTAYITYDTVRLLAPEIALVSTSVMMMVVGAFAPSHVAVALRRPGRPGHRGGVAGRHGRPRRDRRLGLEFGSAVGRSVGDDGALAGPNQRGAAGDGRSQRRAPGNLSEYIAALLLATAARC